MHLPQLHRIRWAVRATLALGVAASVTANVLHAQPNPISQAIAAWPPLALLVTIELISRVPVHRRWLAAARFVATTLIAGIAAWVSYWHMAGVAARYGETGASSYLLPLSVDGLVIVASVSLVELAGRIRTAERTSRVPTVVPAPQAALSAADVAPPTPETADRLEESTPPRGTPAPPPETAAPPRKTADPDAAPRKTTGTPRKTTGTPRKTTGTPRKTTGTPRKTTGTPRPRRPVAETAALAAAIEATQPDLTAAEIAQQLGITTSRLRAVRRETRELQAAA